MPAIDTAWVKLILTTFAGSITPHLEQIFDLFIHGVKTEAPPFFSTSSRITEAVIAGVGNDLLKGGFARLEEDGRTHLFFF